MGKSVCQSISPKFVGLSASKIDKSSFLSRNSSLINRLLRQAAAQMPIGSEEIKTHYFLVRDLFEFKGKIVADGIYLKGKC